MHIFSKTLRSLVAQNARHISIVAGVVVVLLLILWLTLWYRERSVLRVNVLTDIQMCSEDAIEDLEKRTAMLEGFLTESKKTHPDFIANLGNVTLREKNECDETAKIDLTLVKEILMNGTEVHTALGTEDLQDSFASYEDWLAFIEREQPFYTFDHNDVHVIVLDTVLGGEPMGRPCEDDAECKEHLHRSQFLSTLLKDESTLNSYLERRETTKEAVEIELENERSIVKSFRSVANMTRSKKKRREGRLRESELFWLRDALEATNKKKILVLSHHPLHPFIYDGDEPIRIGKSDSARAFLRRSGKEVVLLSARGDDWQEHHDENLHFFDIGNFVDTDTGQWAEFTWDRSGFRLERRGE